MITRPCSRWRCRSSPSSPYTDAGDIVFEPFGGSGTTMLAAQRTGRICRSVEIAPEYVDVAIKRFQQNHPACRSSLIATGQSFDDVATEREMEVAMSASWLADKIEQWPTAKLLPYARNARTPRMIRWRRSPHQIAEFGFTNPILGGRRRHHHRRWAWPLGRCAETPGWRSCRGRTGSPEPDQRRALVIADNRIAENAGWDDAMLRIELEALQLEGFDLDITGFDADALAELIAGDEPDNEARPMRTRYRRLAKFQYRARAMSGSWASTACCAATRPWQRAMPG